MATAASWWAIGINVQPIAGVGTSYTYFQGTKAQAQAQAAKYVDGTVTGPFATEADAKAAVAAGKVSPSPQAAETPSEIEQQVTSGGGVLGTLAGFLGVGSVSGTNLVIRGLKIIVGGVLLIVGLVHMTGVGGAVADIARKVPVPI